MMRTVIFTTLFSSLAMGGPIKTKDVSYKQGGQTFKGFLASPDTKESRPAVLVVHEWWGHNDYARKRAKMLAEAGYVALALDMYGDGKVANHPNQAGELSGALRKDMKVAEDRFDAALNELKSQPGVDKEKIAVIGYCFGGSIALEMARRGKDLDVVASFHGSLTSEQALSKGKFKGTILVFHGAEDPFVKKEEVAAFEKEMAKGGARYEIISYPGATHSFTNPDADKLGAEFNLPLGYNKNADEASWKKLLEEFKKAFGV